MAVLFYWFYGGGLRLGEKLKICYNLKVISSANLKQDLL